MASFKLPQIKAMGTTFKMPTISVPKIGMVRTPKIGVAHQTLSGLSKTKVKFK